MCFLQKLFDDQTLADLMSIAVEKKDSTDKTRKQKETESQKKKVEKSQINEEAANVAVRALCIELCP